MKKPIVLVHGGAGEWPSKKRRAGLRGVRRAATEGWKILRSGGSSTDAVEAAVVSMEDDPTFNAGIGSAMNLAGGIEMDAAIMEGDGLKGGAVAMVRNIQNPVRLARVVMEFTDHVLVGGRGAERLARAFGIKTANLGSEARLRQWQTRLRDFRLGKTDDLSKNYQLLAKGMLEPMETVGALARDSEGSLAAGCSTGGLALKLPGRIGDSAILGAGLYADDSTGAATATGIGEIAMRTLISKNACDLMRQHSAAVAAENSIRHAASSVGRGLGLLTLDSRGEFGIAHSTPHLCWAVAQGPRSRSSMTGTRV